MNIDSILPQLTALLKKHCEIETAVIETGSLPAHLEKDLFEIDLKNPDAIEAYNFMVENMERAQEAWNVRANEASKVSKDIGKLITRYNEFIKKVLVDSGTEDLRGRSFRFKLSKVKPKLVIENEEGLLSDYSKEKIEVILDKDRIKQDLELGVPVPGARLEQGYSLRKYPIKGLV